MNRSDDPYDSDQTIDTTAADVFEQRPSTRRDPYIPPLVGFRSRSSGGSYRRGHRLSVPSTGREPQYSGRAGENGYLLTLPLSSDERPRRHSGVGAHERPAMLPQHPPQPLSFTFEDRSQSVVRSNFELSGRSRRTRSVGRSGGTVSRRSRLDGDPATCETCQKILTWGETQIERKTVTPEPESLRVETTVDPWFSECDRCFSGRKSKDDLQRYE